MRTLIIVAVIAAALLTVTVALAQEETRARRGGPGAAGRDGGWLLRLFDANNDGKITQAEWIAAFKKIDENGDGALSTEEITKSQEQLREEARKRYFDSIDKDGNGKISKEEFQGPSERFDRMDADGNGAITPEEFGNAARRFRGRREGAGPETEKELEKEDKGGQHDKGE